jgi:exopolyphosphatase/guanosine-5'-triphosphate,3'-diphosphate pyrophosphatase
MLAAIDLGSNSFRLHIARHEEGSLQIVKSLREPIRLAASLDENGDLSPQAIRAAIDTLKRFSSLLKSYPLDGARVVATNTLRIAKNTEAFLPEAEEAIGYPIEIISGEEEGRLIYMGVACALNMPAEKRLVIDIGGGSTELIIGTDLQIEQVESFSVGNVKHSFLHFENGAINEQYFQAAILSARSYFADAAPIYRDKGWEQVYGSSGTIRSIADAIAKNRLGDGRLSRHNLEELKNRLIQCGHVSQISLDGMRPDRAPVIAGGLAILIGLTEELNFDVLHPVEAGLRMGVLWDLQLRADKRDRREQSVHEFMQRFQADSARARRTAGIAQALFQQLKPSYGNYERFVYWAGLLHEVGQLVSHSGYHKHGAYLIEHADLAGFTSREQRLLSRLVLGHKGNLRKLNGALSESDFAKALLALRLAVLLMHSRIEQVRDKLSLKMKNKIECELSQDYWSSQPTLLQWMKREREYWNEIGIEFSIVRKGKN